MHSNLYGQVFREEQEVIDLLFQNPDLDITKINFADNNVVDKFNNSAKLCNLDITIHKEETPNISTEEFDQQQQCNWFIPKEYLDMDIEIWLYEKCQTETEFSRVQQEYDLFKSNNMVIVLKVVKYLVDTFRANNVVWGVGRGSSVASYCLYLLGLHKINSIDYNLDIGEFLK